MIEIRYVLQLDDFIDAVRASYAGDKRGKIVRIAAVVVGLSIIPLVFYTRSFGEGHELSYWIIPLALGLAWSAAFQSPARRSRTYYRKSVTGEEVTGQFDETRMVTFSAKSRTEMLWSAFERWIEGDKTFVLYSANLMYVFPKRAFSDQSSAEFHTLLKEKIRPNPGPAFKDDLAT